MKKRLVLPCLVFSLISIPVSAQTVSATVFSLIPPNGVGNGYFTNGNGDNATFTTVDNEIDSWWGLGIKSPCCNSYNGYGIVFNARSGSLYTQGSIGIGTNTPVTALSLAGASDPNPNTGAQRYYANGGLTFRSTTGFTVGQIAPVQETGQFEDRGDMAFLVGQGGGTTQEAIRILGVNGSVGIGATNPGAKLEVNGNFKLTAGSGASVTYQDGSVQTVAWNGVLSGGDYAESVDVIGDREQYEPGDVMVIDPSSNGKFRRSTEAYSTAVMGVYSTRPGVVGRRQKTDKLHMSDEVPMAMVGVVPTKVSAESGAIKPGDLLVTSSKPGYAMKGTDRTLLLGAIIGKAMDGLDTGTGVIEVAISIQ